MAKSLHYIKPWDASYFFGVRNNDAQADAYVLEFRDSVRAALDPNGDGLTWTVSDIVKWQGYQSGVDRRGRAFVIQHRDGAGNATGHEWLAMFAVGYDAYIIGGTSSSSQASNAIAPYWRGDNNSNPSLTYYGRFFIHYNDTADTTPYGMGLNPDGSHPDGDFGAPSKNPWSEFEEFMPPGKLRSVITVNNFHNTYSARSQIILVVDEEYPYIALYATQGKRNDIRTIWLAGNIIVPYRSQDPYVAGVAWWDLVVDSGGAGAPGNREHCYVYDHQGGVAHQNLRYHNQFTEFNVPLDDGKYPWDVVSLGTDAYYKGYLDSDIVRVMGPRNEKYLSLYDGGNFIKYHHYLCFPYVPNKVVFPPGE